VADAREAGDVSAIEPIYGRLAEAVTASRRALGVTQEQLADHVGLSRPSIANIEAGRQRVDLATFVRLRDHLAFDQDSVLGLPPDLPTRPFLRAAMDVARDKIERHVAGELRRRLGR
jgi:transcriptional regulator with XRE-family HTH domain